MDISLIDICFPDYFVGSSDPYLQVSITPRMTHAQVKEAIRRAVDDECFDPGWDEEKYNQLRRLVNKTFGKYLHTYSKEMPSDEDGGTEESVYAYIRVSEKE